MGQSLKEKVTKSCERYGNMRKFVYKQKGKKVTLENLKQEVAIARITGELSGAEKILTAICANLDWSREDIEAEIHLYIESLANISSEYLQGKRIVNLEDILSKYGYFDNTQKEEQNYESK